MKKSIISLTVALASLTNATAQTQLSESPDTITIVKNVEKLTVVENSNGMKVIIDGTTDNPFFQSVTEEIYPNGAIINSRQTLIQHFRSRNSNSAVTALEPTVALGFVLAPGDGNAGIEPSKSFEISIFEITGINFNFPNKTTSASIGIGMTWRNWRTTKETSFTVTPDGGIATMPYDSDITPRFSRLKQFSLSLPVMFNQKLPVKISNRNLSIRFGGIFNWNSHASMKTAWINSEGNNCSESADNIGHRKFSVDIAAIVNITPWAGIYCRYSPSPMLKKGFGQQFRTFTTGLAFTL